ncbi:MAG: hypothetical protein WD577_03945 [Bacteroidales bacterium]
MKTKMSFIFSLAMILFLSVSAMAQSDSKVIAVINHAEWCSVCQNNGERAQATFMEKNKDGAIQFLANDLTDEASKRKSTAALKEVGLDKVMAENKGTGTAYFFDAETKKLITKISVAKSDEELADAVATAKKAAK